MTEPIQGELPIGKNPTLAQARRERDEAMARVEENAGQDWQDYAVMLIAQVAKEKISFTSDDVMEKMTFKPHDCRALGPAMKKAQSLGIIKATSVFRLSTRRHATPLRVWNYGPSLDERSLDERSMGVSGIKRPPLGGREFLDDMENWVCPKCGERANCHFSNGNWRWNGSAWEHSHEYPLGHVLAERKPKKDKQ